MSTVSLVGLSREGKALYPDSTVVDGPRGPGPRRAHGKKVAGTVGPGDRGRDPVHVYDSFRFVFGSSRPWWSLRARLRRGRGLSLGSIPTDPVGFPSSVETRAVGTKVHQTSVEVQVCHRPGHQPGPMSGLVS